MNDGTDPIDIVRAARHRVSERLDHEPAKVVEYYMKLQEAYRGRLLEECIESAEAARRRDEQEGSSRNR